MPTYTEPLSFRLPPDLDALLDAEADRLRLRRSDVARLKLAEALTMPRPTIPQDVVSGMVVKG